MCLKITFFCHSDDDFIATEMLKRHHKFFFLIYISAPVDGDFLQCLVDFYWHAGQLDNVGLALAASF